MAEGNTTVNSDSEKNTSVNVTHNISKIIYNITSNTTAVFSSSEKDAQNLTKHTTIIEESLPEQFKKIHISDKITSDVSCGTCNESTSENPQKCVLNAELLAHLTTLDKPVNVRELATKFTLYIKKDINSALYQLMQERRVQKTEDKPPLWAINKNEIDSLNIKQSQSVVELEALNTNNDGINDSSSTTLLQSTSKSVSKGKIVVEKSTWTDQEIQDKIINYMKKSAEKIVSALNISNTFSLNKQTINKALYALKNQGVVSQVAGKSLWSLTQT